MKDAFHDVWLVAVWPAKRKGVHDFVKRKSSLPYLITGMAVVFWIVVSRVLGLPPQVKNEGHADKFK